MLESDGTLGKRFVNGAEVVTIDNLSDDLDPSIGNADSVASLPAGDSPNGAGGIRW